MAKQKKSPVKVSAVDNKAILFQAKREAKWRKQLVKNPNDVSNPLHKEYVPHNPPRVEKEKVVLSHHPSVFDGKERPDHKERKERPMEYLKAARLVIK